MIRPQEALASSLLPEEDMTQDLDTVGGAGVAEPRFSPSHQSRVSLCVFAATDLYTQALAASLGSSPASFGSQLLAAKTPLDVSSSAAATAVSFLLSAPP